MSLPRQSPLGRDFFARDALAVARALIGATLLRVGPGGRVRAVRIVETEAYRGPRDAASHARAGLTARTRTLFGPPGRAYVYFIYGMYDCFNVVCFAEGKGHAVLVRAGEPLEGIDEGTRTDGPGRLCRALAVTRLQNAVDLLEPGGELLLLPRDKRPRIATSARVGVAYAGEIAEAPWRFYDPASAHVSKPPRRSIGLFKGSPRPRSAREKGRSR